MMTRRTASVLLVEDDSDVARSLVDLLESNGHQVCCAENAAQARSLLRQVRPDLVVLDLMLPDTDGLMLCDEIRAVNDVPIIICSGTTRQRDRVLGLKLGADDFIPKPFEPWEFEARVEAVLRRTDAGRRLDEEPHAPATRLTVGNLELDLTLRRAALGGALLPLTPTEFRLLLAFASRPEVVHSREELAEQVWGQSVAGTRAIDVHVSRLREKLRHDTVPAPSIVAVRNFGYRLTIDDL